MSEQVRAILDEVGIDSSAARITPLTGGVSCETARVELPDRTLVVKQALGKLKVQEDWHSSPDRITAEASGLVWFHHLTPDNVPLPLGVAPTTFGLVLPHAPTPCPDLRNILLDDPAAAPEGIGSALGQIALTWHQASPESARGGLLDDQVRVTELRIDPFYRDMATRWPDHRATIDVLVAELLDNRPAVIHGDFTPKNVLCVSDGGLWVIDTEIAHIGNPVLDSASMLTHLILKSLHWADTDHADIPATIRDEFLATISRHPASAPATLGQHIGVIMAVRVAGRARVPYLSAHAHDAATALAHTLLDGAPLKEALHP
jgi:hypothetical protein